MTPEGEIVRYIKKRVHALGGEVRKVSWEGRIGAPDLMVLLPGVHFWIEVKRPGEKPRPAQLREHDKMRSAGCLVYIADSIPAVNMVISARSENAEIQPPPVSD